MQTAKWINMNLLLLFALCFSSCKTEASGKQLKVLLAEKLFWAGGREGVRGVNYHLQLQNTSGKTLQVKSLMVDNVRLPAKVSAKNAMVDVTAVYIFPRKEVIYGEPVVAEGQVNTDEVLLLYQLGASKPLSTLKITKFVEKSEEPVP